MRKNTDKGNSKLRLSNGSTIDISNVKVDTADVKVDPVTGNFTAAKSLDDSFTVTFSFQTTDYQEQFENKRQALHDMVEDGDGFTKEEIRDLVKTANLLVWQESKDA